MNTDIKAMEKVKRSAILLLIILVAISLRLYCFRGYVGLDDAEYARFAHQMAQGSFTIGAYDGPAVFPLRVGNIFPTSLLFHFFGTNEWTMVLYPFTLSIMCILIAYICSARLFNHRAGLIAASLWAILPIEMSNATQLLPDLPAAFYASVGVVCILFLIDSRTKHKSLILCGGILAGLLFGLSWLCKETVVYLVPFCLILLIITIKHNWKRNALLWVGVAAGSLGVLLIEMIVYYNLTGDWLFRFHEMERNYLQWADGFFTEGSRWGWPVGGSYAFALFKRLFIIGPEFIFFNLKFLFLPLLGIVACFHAFYWKEKNQLFVSLWLITLLFMFNFSSSSLSSYMPIALFDRYLYPICFPAILLSSVLIDKLCSSYVKIERSEPLIRERFFWAIVIAVFTVVIGGYQTFRNIRDVGGNKLWASEVEIVSSYVKPEEQIYTDFISKRGLEFFWRYPDKMKIINFEGIKSSDDINAGSFVLINRRYADWLDTNSGMWLSDSSGYKKPEFFDHPPPSWKRVWGNANAALYHVR